MFADLDCGIEPMDTSDTPWYWFYQAECDIWHRTEDDPVNPMSSSELERYYLRNPEGVLEISTARGCFRIDFSQWTQTNLTTGQKRQLKRSLYSERSIRCNCVAEALNVPAHWVDMDTKEPYQNFCLSSDTKEFREVEKYTREIGLLQEPIRKIYRIQNLDLWELYHRKKTQLMRIKKQSTIEEQMLFHGTSKKNVESICTYNFDCRISAKHGHVYGKGTYFAKHASLADKYSRNFEGANSIRIMFLARVMVGKYKIGESNLYKPDGNQKENIHDSCVDDTLCPRIFVVFDHDQIYPEYLLEYGR